MYEMKKGILIRNTEKDLIGTALEYTYTTMFAYRYDKCPDCVRIKINDVEKVWMLKECEPYG